MIRDAKGGLFSWLIERYIARKIRRQFRGVWVRGVLPEPTNGLLVYANHSNFWDGFVIHQLAQFAGWNAYALMEEENLQKYPFHTRIGAIGIKRADPKSSLQTIRYCREVLKRPRAALFIFPEGEISAGQGPLKPLSRGLEVIAKQTAAVNVPIAIRYAFLEHEYPDVLIDVGAPHAATSIEDASVRLNEVWQRVLQARSTEGFRQIARGQKGIQQSWDAARRLPAAGVASETAHD